MAYCGSNMRPHSMARFREAADKCSPPFGDRRAYQMDSGNAREAMREARIGLRRRGGFS